MSKQATIHVQGSLLDKVRWYYATHKLAIHSAIAFITIFLVIGFVINPIGAGNPIQGEVRSNDVNNFSLSHGGVYMEVEFNATIPEGDGLGGVTYTTAIKTARIPLVMDRLDPFQGEEDSGKQMVFNYITGGATSVLLGEMDDQSGFNLWNPMENLINAQDTYITSLLGAQIYPTNLSRVFWKDDYQGVTVYSSFTSRPGLYDETWHYTQRYTATVPSPAQFAYMICAQNGWTLNNVTDAFTETLLGTGGLRPSYVVENFGVPCDIDNDTSDYIIDMVPTGEADRMMADGSLPAMGYISSQNDYHSYYVQMYDNEKDTFTDSIFLGNFLINGMVPHTMSILQCFDGGNIADAMAEYIFQQVYHGGEADKEMSGKEDGVYMGVNEFFLLIWLVVQVADSSGYTRGKAEGFDEGKNTGIDQTTLYFEKLLYNMSYDLNMSKQQLQAALDEVSRINTYLKTSITNPYNKSGNIMPGITTPYQMPSSISLILIFGTAAVVVGIMIIVFVIYYVLKRRKKKGEQEVPEGMRPVKRQEESVIARAGSTVKSVLRK